MYYGNQFFLQSRKPLKFLALLPSVAFSPAKSRQMTAWHPTHFIPIAAAN